MVDIAGEEGRVKGNGETGGEKERKLVTRNIDDPSDVDLIVVQDQCRGWARKEVILMVGT